MIKSSLKKACVCVPYVFVIFSLSVCAFSWFWHYFEARSGVDVPFFFYKRGSLLEVCAFIVLFAACFLMLSFLIGMKRMAYPEFLKKRYVLYVLIAMVSLCVDLWVVDFSPPSQVPDVMSDAGYYYNSAVAFSRGESELFMNRGHVGVLRAPLIYFFGEGVQSFFWLDAFIKIMCGVLIYKIYCLRFRESLWGAFLTPLLFVTYLPVATQPSLLMADLPFLVLFLLGLYNLLLWEKHESYRFLILSAVMLGLSHWIRPVAMMLWFAVILYFVMLCIQNRLSIKKSVQAMVVYTVFFVFSIAWLLYANAKTQGTYSPSYMEARGYILYQGTVPYEVGHIVKGDYKRFEAITGYINQQLDHQKLDNEPFGSESVQGYIKKLAWENIRENPVGFLQHSTFHKWARLWLAEGSNAWSLRQSEALLIATLLAVWILMLSYFKRGFDSFEFLMLVVISGCASLHWLVVSYDRYALYCYPLMIVLCVRGSIDLAGIIKARLVVVKVNKAGGIKHYEAS